jgi:hypothetical protein
MPTLFSILEQVPVWAWTLAHGLFQLAFMLVEHLAA